MSGTEEFVQQAIGQIAWFTNAPRVAITEQANPANTYTVPSAPIAAAHTGTSSKVNTQGMRAMQERADLVQLATTGLLDTGRRVTNLVNHHCLQPLHSN